MLHDDRRGPRVERAGGEERVDRVGHELGHQVVDVGLEHEQPAGAVRRRRGRAEQHPDDVRDRRRVARARADPHAFEHELGDLGRGPAERRDDRGRGRRHGLGELGAGDRGSEREPREQLERHRRGRPVRPLVRGRRHRERRDVDAFDAEGLQRRGHADDVEQRVLLAELLELELVDRPPVDLRLGLEHPLEDGRGSAAHPLVERRAFDRVEQLPRPASLGRQVTRDRERERPQTLPAHLGGRAPDAAAEHRGHGIGHLVRGRAGVEQRRQEHVARRAADDVDVQDPHRVAAPHRGADCRAIIAAMVPAPTPSSTFTHATPGAHEESIDSSAARPPSDAP